MHPQALADELERDPFIPLRLRLDDGQVVDILNPGLAFISKQALYVFRVDRPHAALAEDHRMIALRHIVSVDLLEPAA